jgi:hypothetical protein
LDKRLLKPDARVVVTWTWFPLLFEGLWEDRGKRCLDECATNEFLYTKWKTDEVMDNL